MSRCALVTGANRGIGSEVAMQLARDNLHVIVAGRDQAGCEALARQITDDGGKASTALLDLRHSDSIDAFLQNNDHKIDVLINNAGIFPDPGVGAFEVDLNDVRDAMEVHFHGPLRLSRALVTGMQQRGYGRVVNLTSGYAILNGMAGQLIAYRASKAALNALTCVLAAEASGDLKINAVDPGWVNTDMGGAKAPRSAEEAGRDVVAAALLAADGPNGKLLRYGEVVGW